MALTMRIPISPATTTRWMRAFPHKQLSLLHQQHRQLSSFTSYLVSPRELSNALKEKATSASSSTSSRIIPLCAAWFMPNDPEGRTGLSVFRKSHIPDARFFDLDAVKDEDSPYPHMLPTSERFAEAMRELGIRREDEVVVYDSQEVGIFSAPRVGWTFKVFGHPHVYILNNYRLWVQQGYPTESGDAKPVEKTDYPVPSYDADRVVAFSEMKDIVGNNGKKGGSDIQVLDARSQGRWSGKENEPRPGLPSGHMPGSKSLPFSELLDPKTKAFLPPAELSEVFEERKVDPSKTVISSCGTGVTAAIIDAGLDSAGYGEPSKRRLYDGSWT